MKSKSTTILIITAIVIFVIIFFLIWPVASKALKSWRDLAKEKKNFIFVQEQKEVLENLKKNQDLPLVAEIARKYIPEAQEAGQLILELTAMAQTSNLIVEQTTLEKTSSPAKTSESEETKASPNADSSPSSSPAPEDQLKTIDFSMKLSGNFPDLFNFLKAIETSSRLIIIKDISLQSKKEVETVSIQIQMTGSAYFKDKITLEENLDNIKISEETINKFLNLKTYGQPINLPTESGFGRANPFENY